MNKKIIALVLAVASASALRAGLDNSVQFRNNTSYEVVVGMYNANGTQIEEVRLNPGMITEKKVIRPITRVVARYGGQWGGKWGMGTQGSSYDNIVPMLPIRAAAHPHDRHDVIVEMNQSQQSGWFSSVSNTIDFGFIYTDPADTGFNIANADMSLNDRAIALAALNLGPNATNHAILGVLTTADKKKIRTAYFNLSRKWHPDKNVGNEEVAKKVFNLINDAYEQLSK